MEKKKVKSKRVIEDSGEYLPGARKDEQHISGGSSKLEPLEGHLPKIEDWWPLPDWSGMVLRGEIKADVACYLHFLRKNLSDKPPYEFRAVGISDEDWDRFYFKAIRSIKSSLYGVKTVEDCKAACDTYNRLMGWTGGSCPKTKDNTIICPPYALGRSTHRSMRHPWSITQMAWYRQNYLHMMGWPTNPVIKENSKYLPCVIKVKGERKWAVVECVGDGVIVKSEYFSDPDEVVSMAIDKNLLEKTKRVSTREYVEPKRPKIDGNIKRVGPDWRCGEMISPEKFMEVLGFRGIQWGGWVPQKERQGILNYAFEALSDLMALFGLPACFSSINGILGISFGARGKGFVSAGSAHYEQGERIIHLTRLSGAGSLAHEWAHALDHYLGQIAKERFKSGDYFSEAVYPDEWETKMGIDRNPSCKVMHNIIVAMTEKKIGGDRCQTDFYTDAISLSHGAGYWSRLREMFARSFEAAVYDMLTAAGRRSDYLVYGAEEDRFAAQVALRGNPYPIGAEREFIVKRIKEAMVSWESIGRFG